ncbi:hypothetical protein ACIBG8_07945 [Nonomuraea sp. NPDC050556]|uniref:hypothetical protein n=1 Tax=Nonomuraea sp. NPDC050556 TaxID=3364369 RepID=UPI0037A8B61E
MSDIYQYTDRDGDELTVESVDYDGVLGVLTTDDRIVAVHIEPDRAWEVREAILEAAGSSVYDRIELRIAEILQDGPTDPSEVAGHATSAACDALDEAGLVVVFPDHHQELLALLAELHDPNPCDHFDHHGSCQTHGWLEDGRCARARAQQLLAALPERSAADGLCQCSAAVPPDDQTPGGRDSEQQPEGRSPSDHDRKRIPTGDREHCDDIDDECGDNSTKNAHVIDSRAQDLRHRYAEALIARIKQCVVPNSGWGPQEWLRSSEPPSSTLLTPPWPYGMRSWSSSAMRCTSRRSGPRACMPPLIAEHSTYAMNIVNGK